MHSIIYDTTNHYYYAGVRFSSGAHVFGSNLNVYPNPASGVVSILFSTIETSKIKLELYDMSGKLVKNLYEGVLNKNAQRKIELQTKSLPAGIYMVSLQTGNRIVSRNKLVVTN